MMEKWVNVVMWFQVFRFQVTGSILRVVEKFEEPYLNPVLV